MPFIPSPSRELNAELCKLLVYLEAPDVAAKTMALMAKAPTQEEQMEYALSLRNLKTGWTPEQRKTYFAWFVKAANYKGGHSFAGFVSNIKKEAVAQLSDQEKAALEADSHGLTQGRKPLAERQAQAARQTLGHRGAVAARRRRACIGATSSMAGNFSARASATPATASITKGATSARI